MEAGPAEPALRNSDEEESAFYTATQATAQGRTRQEADEALVINLAGAPVKEPRWLGPCIEVLAAAQVELGVAADPNLAFDLATVERLFVSAIIYKNADAAERCWQMLLRAISRVRLLRKRRAVHSPAER
jgi:hypothetical protein